MASLLEELKWRESFNQTTDEKGLDELLEEQKIKAYVGVDPTAGSIHIGHLIPLTILRRLQLRGHKPVIVVGGGTGMIGDPSGKKNERKLLSDEDIQKNVDSLKKQFENLFGTEGFEIVNNKDWLGQLDLISFLRDYGKLFPINVMLKRDVVASRLEAGISFTEFTYQILQSIDFLTLFRQGVQLQIGGSDQYGNISSGVELIHKSEGSTAKAFGLTAPLLLKSDGTKFGKSEGGTVWLDEKLTSPYQLYQFFLNQSDDDVIRLLKIYTFKTPEEIADLEIEVRDHPEKRVAQQELASEVVKFVHSDEALEQAKRITEILFNGNINDLTVDELEAAFLGDATVPTFEVHENPINVVDLLVSEEVVEKSKRQAREDVTNGAITINGTKVTDIDAELDLKNNFEGKYVFVKKGKKKNFLGLIK
ncbi:MAG: tyrosine--tRNA ligase [Lactobacillaceae bacterium]|nr:tyrosine--tRNA ligase [Lactobacillaceae bacterium]